MDASLFHTLQTTRAAAAHAVGTSLLPKSGPTSNLRSITGGGVLPQAATGAQSAAATTPTTGTSTTATDTTGASTITSNDFLTLLVSELKNQDPTQPTDPNAYISQLVGVNSLEQLIDINKGLTAIETPATTTNPPAKG